MKEFEELLAKFRSTHRHAVPTSEALAILAEQIESNRLAIQKLQPQEKPKCERMKYRLES